MACTGKVRLREPAPPFTCEAVVCGNFEELSLDYYISKEQWLILLFIPMAFSFVCPTEVIAFSDKIDEFTSRGCALAFVSTDSKYGLWTWQNRSRKEGGLGKISVPLLSDQSHKISRDYGVLLEDRGISLRGMFLISPQGIVKQMTINDLSVGRSVSEAIRLLEAFQTTEKFGIVCPANWNPGAETIVPTIQGQQAYLDRTMSKDEATSATPSREASRPTSVYSSLVLPNVVPSPPVYSALDSAFVRMGLSGRTSARSSAPNSPLASPTEGVFGHKRTPSGLNRTSYFE